MKIKTLYSKLHCAICTESRLDYMGSVTIDQDWIDKAGLQSGQAVDVLNIDNGSRLTTYVISGKRGLGEICLNGAAAHYFEPGDKIIIIAYCDLTLDEKKDFKPKVLLLDEPSLGIAPKLVNQIFVSIKNINKEKNVTIFLVEQNAKKALELADRAYVLVNGKVTIKGSGQELLKNKDIQAAYLEGGAKN